MKKAVLVIGTDPAVKRPVSQAAQARGVDVEFSTDTPALPWAAPNTAFALVVVDLAHATDGWDFVTRLREHDPSIETIVIAEDGRLPRVAKAHAYAMFAFVRRPFDAAFLAALVDRALERRRLSRELGLLNEVAEILASSLDVNSVLDRVAERVAASFNVSNVAIRLRSSPSGEAVVVAAAGAPAEGLQQALVEAGGVMPSDRVLAEGVTLRLDDITGKEPFAATSLYQQYPWRSAVFVPIMAAEAIVGSIAVGSLEPKWFTQNDENALTTLGRQLGVAATNSQLYQRVQHAKSQWERTVDAISDPIAVFGADLKTLRANAPLAQLGGWKVAEALGRSCGEVGLCGGGCPNCLVGLALGQNTRFDRELSTADGRIFAVTTFPVRGNRGEVVQIAREVTEERRRSQQLRDLSEQLATANVELVSTLGLLRSTQAQLVQAEKLSALGQLVAGVAHEVNNPLTSVMGYAQLVQEQLEQRPGIAERAHDLVDDVRLIVSEAERAARIVRNLLTFARRQAADRTSHDARKLVARVVELRGYELRLKGIDVAMDFAVDLPPVFVDSPQIQQALLNLLLNAEQAMEQSAVRRLDLVVTAEPWCGAVLIEVRDTGHGIEPGDLKRVFDPFFTTRGVGEGTGLGLSIVYGTVRDHGGQVWVQSRRQYGASFFVRLPARDPARLPAVDRPVVVGLGDAMVLEFVTAALGGWGFDVHMANTSRAALEQVSEDEPALLVLDPALVEEDPAAWKALWARRGQQNRVLVVSSGGTEDEALQFMRAQIGGFVAQPYDLAQLFGALASALGPSPSSSTG